MMITDNRKPEWFFYPGWVVLSAICFPIAFAIYWVLIFQIEKVVGDVILVGGQRHITEDFLVPYILWPAAGLVTGLLQYLLLRRYLQRIGWWIAATTLGLLLGLIGGRLLSHTLYALDVDSIWFETLMAALAGGSMGLAQWLVLHQRVRHAAWWILANVMGWGILGWGAAALSNQMAIPAVGIMLTPGIATSVALWLLLDRLLHKDNG
jgi:hypothetical protein